MADFLETALTAAREASAILMKHYGHVAKADIRKKSATDFLSFVDEQSEQRIREVILERFPDHAILGEEGGEQGRDRKALWIVDPLDGTKNYLSTIPFFAVSIALQWEGRLEVAVIADPVHGDYYTARRGGGAFKNGRAIRVSSITRLEEAFLATGFPFKTRNMLPRYMALFQEMFGRCVGVRRLGAAALDLALVADGVFDGFWEIGLKPWDVAAGALLVKEAGGRVTDFWGDDKYLNNSYIAAGNGHIQPVMLDVIQKIFPTYQPIV